MSSTTTYTMAPAAKASAYGRIGTIMATRAAPRRPAMGSTRPDSCPYQMAFAVEEPAALRGKDTATPSGKFWMEPWPGAGLGSAVTGRELRMSVGVGGREAGKLR